MSSSAQSWLGAAAPSSKTEPGKSSSGETTGSQIQMIPVGPQSPSSSITYVLSRGNSSPFANGQLFSVSVSVTSIRRLGEKPSTSVNVRVGPEYWHSSSPTATSSQPSAWWKTVRALQLPSSPCAYTSVKAAPSHAPIAAPGNEIALIQVSP